MSAVIASPEAVDALAHVLDDGAAELGRRARDLDGALRVLAATDPGSWTTPSADLLAEQSRRIGDLAADLRAFSAALRAADEAGAALAFPATRRRPSLVMLDATSVEAYAPVDDEVGVASLLGRLLLQAHHHDQRRPALGLGGADEYRRWLRQRQQLDARIAQLQARLQPRYPRWGGVGRAWSSARELLDDAEAGRLRALARRPRGPFADAALGTDSLLTTDLDEVLVELDDIATMPLARFAEVHSDPDRRSPLFDWSSDGCSGPIPPGATAACLRHDFLYRNARLLRDQWGLGEGFALAVKAAADRAFVVELTASYPAELLNLVPVVRTWIAFGGLVVRIFGDVDDPWTPPGSHRVL